jgi:hypothetical protein
LSNNYSNWFRDEEINDWELNSCIEEHTSKNTLRFLEKDFVCHAALTLSPNLQWSGDAGVNNHRRKQRKKAEPIGPALEGGRLRDN